MDEPSPKARAVLDIVETIPAGSVMSYGDVAACAGLGSARFVGHVLARFGDDVPWHRVVMSDGSFARHLAVEQAALLRREATPLTGDGARVDMARARFA
ncbi:MAG TPA: MGMT family protein [Acidimicrobiales bacterium]|nr:MGMT family protein [Acidimicrobiales bacterium]